MLRIYGLRTAAIFLVMIVALGAGTFMLREAATAQVIGARKGYAGDNGPAIAGGAQQSGRHRGRIERRHLLRRLEQPRDSPHRPAATTSGRSSGNNALGAGFSGDFGAGHARRSSTRPTACASRLTAT